MTNATIRAVVSARHTIDASALESPEAINHRLKDGGITLHLSEVNGPIMDRLKWSHFKAELTDQVHLTQLNAVPNINSDLARRILDNSIPDSPAA